MNDKIALVALSLVVAVGLTALVGLSNQQTGAAQIETPLCRCELTMFSYYGQPLGMQINYVRSASLEAHTDAGCQIRCDEHFGPGGKKGVAGYAVPLGEYTPPIDYIS